VTESRFFTGDDADDADRNNRWPLSACGYEPQREKKKKKKSKTGRSDSAMVVPSGSVQGKFDHLCWGWLKRGLYEKIDLISVRGILMRLI
jgi:hypothetical protein